jgi:transcriptional regulator with XRE-family HTH domain
MGALAPATAPGFDHSTYTPGIDDQSEEPVMSLDYAQTVGTRLRDLRLQQALTLQGVQEKSAGRWKANVVSSYERGDRMVTVARLAALAEFYGVPTEELLPDARRTRRTRRTRPGRKLAIDLQRLAELPTAQAGPLARYAAAIQSQRCDYNGKVLTIWEQDLQSLAVLYDLRPESLTELFTGWGVLTAATKPK